MRFCDRYTIRMIRSYNTREKSMRSKKSTVILLILFIIGLSLLLYPSISDFWNSKTQTEAIINYEAMLAAYKPEDYTAIFEEADEYNRQLAELDFPLRDHMEINALYWQTLDISGTGMMGYLTVPKISQELPVYHGTSEGVLSTAAGHFQGSSLPVGGVNTHSVVSAHRGLPTAVLFTHLDRMEVGDTFTFTILDRVLTYEVDQIRIVEPDDITLIQIEPGQDYCTLITCTPYGINTHRLLVRAHQIDASQKSRIYVANEAYRVDPMIVMPIAALPIIFLWLGYVLFVPVTKEALDEET